MKRIVMALLVAILIVTLSGCRQSNRVSYNVSKEADNFNVIRRLSVINARTDKPVLEIVAALAIEIDSDGDLNVICQTGPDEYKKHIVNLNTWTIYVIEDISGANVDPYRYEINYLPEMLAPLTITSSY